MRDFRCPCCSRLLFRIMGFILKTTIEIKCDKCNDVVTINAEEIEETEEEIQTTAH